MVVVERVRGQIRDVDSHEFTPAHLWPDLFGEFTRPFAEFFMKTHDPDEPLSLGNRVEQDDAPITPETMTKAWGQGALAPGAFDMTRRVDVMDVVGVGEQFIFPTGLGLMPLVVASAELSDIERAMGVEMNEATLGFDLTPDMLNLVAVELGRLHNDWCIEVSKISPRLRPVAVLDTRDMAAAIAEAQRVIDAGVRAVTVPSGVPLGGKAPGHPDTDPFWELLTSEDVPLLLHGGSDLGFFRDTTAWRDYGVTGARLGDKGSSPELLLDPYSISIVNAGAENFVTLMIYSGAFERFPTLRVGCIELSAYWVGPLAENLEQVGRQFRRLTSHLSLTPGEYLQRNVRVAPFWWESVDKYIDRFGLEDVYVYGSDYPHFEGGKDPAALFSERLERLGPTVVEKFFVRNAELLMP